MLTDDFVQIEECGQQRANYLLAAGYKLLLVNGTSWEKDRRRSPDVDRAATFIAHNITYVIGRTTDQPAFPDRKAREVEAVPS